MNILRNRKLITILSWMAVSLWMLLIFNMSSQEAEESNKLSEGVTEIVVETVEKVAPNIGLTVDDFNHTVRKNAHFFSYMILGILVLNALRRSGVKDLRGYGFALSICVLYAISDEIHQHFVPGREPGVKDVFIDSAGSIVGLGLYLIMSIAFKKRHIKES